MNQVRLSNRQRSFSSLPDGWLCGLAETMGIIQGLVSDYERDKLRPHAEMVVRFALALEVSNDELLGLKKMKTSKTISNRRLLRRLQQIEALPKKAQDTIIGMIDLALKNK
ncbi:MAG: helix-turn-helix transcriptional regulator [Planctomycetota bacterium]